MDAGLTTEEAEQFQEFEDTLSEDEEMNDSDLSAHEF